MKLRFDTMRSMSHLWRLPLFAMLLVALNWAPLARGATLPAATCTSSGAATITLSDVTLPQNPTVGTKLGTPGTASITFTCKNLPVTSNGTTSGSVSTADRTAWIQAGETLAPLDASNNPGGPGITFATNVPGIALLVTASPTQATSYSDATLGDRSQEGPDGTAGYAVTSVTGPSSVPSNCTSTRTSGCFSGSAPTQTFTAQLIVTGPVTPGAVDGLALIPFWWYIPGGDQNSVSKQISGATLNLASGTNVKAPACSVNTDSQTKTVTLPTVSTKALGTTVGSTSGLTPFNINLSCQSGAKVSITLNTSNPATPTGVIAPTTGSGLATNVGVQVLYNGTSQANAVTFGAAQSVGTAPSNGAMSIPYYAQYYVTAATPTAGTVQATATFTLSYQ